MRPIKQVRDYVTENPTWHQQNAAKREYAMRKFKAHILATDYVWTGKAVCGQSNPKVHVAMEFADKPKNNVCKRCLARSIRV